MWSDVPHWYRFSFTEKFVDHPRKAKLKCYNLPARSLENVSTLRNPCWLRFLHSFNTPAINSWLTREITSKSTLRVGSVRIKHTGAQLGRGKAGTRGGLKHFHTHNFWARFCLVKFSKRWHKQRKDLFKTEMIPSTFTTDRPPCEFCGRVHAFNHFWVCWRCVYVVLLHSNLCTGKSFNI